MNSFSSRKPGDWNCVSCGDFQFARNERCRKCNTPRPRPAASAVQPVAPKIRKGDWICAACNDVQFASRVNCRKCGASKPLDEADEDNDDIACMICNAHERNASLLHGDSVHIVCCLECANDVFRNHGNCPMCRQPIEAVLKTFQ